MFSAGVFAGVVVAHSVLQRLRGASADRRGAAGGAGGGSSSAPDGESTAVRVCVFCGSSAPKGERGERIMAAATALGEALASRGIELVYGGGGVGVMGALARSVDSHGGVVRGIIPRALSPKEASGVGVQLHNAEIVETMHERKKRMAELSDAFIALPGGFGTFEELLEMITWSQLGIHRKTVGVLDAGGFYRKLLEFFNDASDSGFIRKSFLDIIVSSDDPVTLLDRVCSHVPPAGFLHGKWDPENT